MKTIIAALILASALVWISVQPVQHVITEKGVHCYKASFALYCNWGEWNAKTNYGQYPKAMSDATGDTK